MWWCGGEISGSIKNILSPIKTHRHTDSLMTVTAAVEVATWIELLELLMATHSTGTSESLGIMSLTLRLLVTLTPVADGVMVSEVIRYRNWDEETVTPLICHLRRGGGWPTAVHLCVSELPCLTVWCDKPFVILISPMRKEHNNYHKSVCVCACAHAPTTTSPNANIRHQVHSIHTHTHTHTNSELCSWWRLHANKYEFVHPREETPYTVMIIATCPEATQPSAAMPLSKSGKCNSWNYGILCIYSWTNWSS